MSIYTREVVFTQTSYLHKVESRRAFIKLEIEIKMENKEDKIISLSEYDSYLERYKGFEGLKELMSKKLNRPLTSYEKSQIDNHYMSIYPLAKNRDRLLWIFKNKTPNKKKSSNWEKVSKIEWENQKIRQRLFKNGKYV